MTQKTTVKNEPKIDEVKNAVKNEVPKNFPVKNEASDDISPPAELNAKSYLPRLGLARAISKKDQEKAVAVYNEVINMNPEEHDAYIELADLYKSKGNLLEAVEVYCKFPSWASNDQVGYDDAYISGEIVHLLMKIEYFDDPRLEDHMIRWGRVLGFSILEKHVTVLESKNKNELLRKIYCGVNHKDENDKDVQQFFKFKFWI